MILDDSVLVDGEGWCAEVVAFGDAGEFDTAALGAEAVAGKLGEGEDEVGDGGGVGVEEVQVEVEGLAGREGLGVEVEGAKDKGAGVVGEAAGASVSSGGGFEEASVGASEVVGAGVGVGAIGWAGDAAEDGAERAAENVGGFAGREVDWLAGEEGEAEGFEVEEQNLSLTEFARPRINWIESG